MIFFRTLEAHYREVWGALSASFLRLGYADFGPLQTVVAFCREDENPSAIGTVFA